MHTPHEYRVYMALRTDYTYPTDVLVQQAATLIIDLMRSCPDALKALYPPTIQPKICVRCKNANAMDTLITTGRAVAPCVTRTHNDDVIMAALGPIEAPALPAPWRRAQLYQGPNQDATPITTAPSRDTGATLYLYHRTDIDIPPGKLMAQIGHAAWAALHAQPDAEHITIIPMPTDITTITTDANIHPIVDSGRTVFHEPTITTAWRWG